MKISTAERVRNKKKIRAEGTALARTQSEIFNVLHSFHMGRKIKYSRSWKRDLLDRNIDYIFSYEGIRNNTSE